MTPKWHLCLIELLFTSDMVDETSEFDRNNSEESYAPIAEALKRLKKPLQGLMESHEAFVLQNVKTNNNVKTMASFRENLERAMERTSV